MEIVKACVSDSSAVSSSQDILKHDSREQENTDSIKTNERIIVDGIEAGSLPLQHSFEKLQYKETREIKKLKRNTGKSYISQSGKYVQERQFKPLPNCRTECHKKVTVEDQKRLFNSYWQQGTYLKRISYIKGFVSLQPIKRIRQRIKKTSRLPKIRKFTAEYRLRVESGDVKVCRNCFKLTFGETESFIENMLSNLWSTMYEPLDKDHRGNRSPKNKSPPEKLQEAENHIKKFPIFEIHYPDSEKSQKYLPLGLNITLMHQLYSKEVQNPLSLKVYRQICNKMGLKPRPPKFEF